jgi:pimeloyl-ACP methyl ester carboxylesterase
MATSTPHTFGNGAYFDKDPGVRLYYELTGSGPMHVVMLTGFAATCRLFDETAAFLASENCSVLTLDYRGAGKSVVEQGQVGSDERQTSRILAHDVLALLEHVRWIVKRSVAVTTTSSNAETGNVGDTDVHGSAADIHSSAADATQPLAGVHVYGASMGGMIAQELAWVLLQHDQLASLYLAVTCSCRYSVRLPFSSGFWSVFMWPLTSPSLVSRDKLVDELLKSCYSNAYLDTLDAATQRPNRLVLQERFAATWDTHMSWNLDTITSQSCVVGTHCTPPAVLQQLRDSGVRIMVHIASTDKSVPTVLQRQLAHELNAKVIEFDGGHLECQADMPRFHAALLANITGIRS